MAQRKRQKSDITSRMAACQEYANSATEFSTIESIVEHKRRKTESGTWVPSSSQMSRDMRSLFGISWTTKREGVGGGTERQQRDSDRQSFLQHNRMVLPEDSVDKLLPPGQQCVM